MAQKQNPLLIEAAKRLEELRTYTSMSKSAFAKMLGIIPANYYPYIQGKTALGADKIVRLFEIFPNLNPKWLFFGEKPIFLEEKEEIKKSTKYNLIEFFQEASLSAGNGSFPIETSPEPVAVSEAFVRNFFKTSPRGLVLFPVIGNSMEPTIPDGAIAVVKKMEFENTFFEGAVYALIFDNELFVKRLRKRKKPEGIEWKLISDNPDYDPIIFLSTENTDIRFEIIGRVVGFLKSLA